MRPLGRQIEGWLLARPSPVVAYGIALALAVGALLARLAIGLWAPNALVFPTFYPAILVAAAIGGAGPGVLAVGVSLLSGGYILVPPKLGFVVENPATAVNLALFLVMALLLVAVGSLLRRVIHRQQQTEEQLGQTQERLMGALHAARTGTWRWDAASDQLKIDPALRALLALPADHGMRRIEDLWSLMPEPSEREEAAAKLEHCLRTGSDLEMEFRTRSSDGRERWWEVRAHFRQRAGGARVVGGVVEVTKQHLTEVALWEAVAARDLLLQEVNHRIKNSLQLVASLLRLQASRAGGDAARRSLEQAQARIMAVAALHRDLYQHNRYDSVEMGGYLQGLAKQLTTSLGEVVAADDLVVDAVQVALPIDTAVPLGLIVNELVTNAIKHGYRDGRGSVAIRLRADDGVRIEVEDRGQGLPPDFDPGACAGLGMTIVMALTKQIGARLVIEPLEPGARFVLHLGRQIDAVDQAASPLAA